MAIYALLDWDTLKKYDISIKDFCKTAKGLKAKILQYRDKNSSLEEKKERLLEIKKHWKKPLIINDTVELLPFCDGIHIGQEDLESLSQKFNLPKYDVIQKLRTGELLEWKMENGKWKINKKTKINNSPLSIVHCPFIVGLSTHNKEEILEANTYPLSYIGLGAYRPTDTKNTDNIIGEKVIDLIKFSNHPVAVIGGVKIYDKIPSKFKVIGSDICRLTSSRLRKKKIFRQK
ncbi:thiamine monophosphate synthase [Nautilia profundicola AmH]|uniref:Thiamine monophosphate synthase n=1 Tax=Nautilia profundicola (strain ATCC BAA-1463 / DSM 18972 / AmH) TaxID=598659 RepID=B9L784_NAUPA|nr:thiamine phosphate synthase [Nautilia profundicola]ACM92641.1 thiamine monophosphate synthase [Nautilia profundicola AmH]